MFPNNISNIPLRLRIVITITAVVLATLCVGTLLTYWHARNKLAVELDGALEHGRVSLTEQLLHATGEHPLADLERIVRSFDKSRHARAIVQTRAGSRVRSTPAEPQVLPPTWFLSLIQLEPKIVPIELPANLAQAGNLRLEAVQINEVVEAWEDFKLKLAVLGVFCSLAMLSLTALITHAIAPIERLIAAFGRVAYGDYETKVPTTGTPELVALLEAFNSMTAELERLRRQNAALDSQISTIQEEERAELARDLHDEVSPLLFGIEIDARTISNHVARLESAPGPVIDRANAIKSTVYEIKQHIRGILQRLRPEIDLGAGFGDAIQHLVSEFQMRHPDVIISTDLPMHGWGTAIDTVVHAMIREGINNALKHGRPRRVHVCVKQQDDDPVKIEVYDDGFGWALQRTPGFGLVSMQERVAQLKGQIAFARHEVWGGVHLRATLPLPKARSGPIEPDKEATSVAA